MLMWWSYGVALTASKPPVFPGHSTLSHKILRTEPIPVLGALSLWLLKGPLSARGTASQHLVFVEVAAAASRVSVRDSGSPSRNGDFGACVCVHSTLKCLSRGGCKQHFATYSAREARVRLTDSGGPLSRPQESGQKLASLASASWKDCFLWLA